MGVLRYRQFLGMRKSKERKENLFDTGTFGYILTSQYVLYGTRRGGTYLERPSNKKVLTRLDVPSTRDMLV